MSEPDGIVGVSQVEVEGYTPHDDQPEIYLGKNVLILFRKQMFLSFGDITTITIIIKIQNHQHHNQKHCHGHR